MAKVKEWARKRLLKKLRAKKRWLKSMENKDQKDVTINVTGVSMTGESQLNEHSGVAQEDKAKSDGEEIGNSREDG
tara:strand:- start:1202 stop:1429 length:228 start_codon:yes stop_codon:yes gene_type:complete